MKNRNLLPTVPEAGKPKIKSAAGSESGERHSLSASKVAPPSVCFGERTAGSSHHKSARVKSWASIFLKGPGASSQGALGLQGALMA
jgi:hypothetical protein